MCTVTLNQLELDNFLNMPETVFYMYQCIDLLLDPFCLNNRCHLYPCHNHFWNILASIQIDPTHGPVKKEKKILIFQKNKRNEKNQLSIQLHWPLFPFSCTEKQFRVIISIWCSMLSDDSIVCPDQFVTVRKEKSLNVLFRQSVLTIVYFE